MQSAAVILAFLPAAGSALATVVSRVGPEKAPSSDVFGHNRKRRSPHENVGRYFDSDAARDFRSSPNRPASDKRSAGRAKGGLSARFAVGRLHRAFEVTLGDETDAFSRPILKVDKPAGRRCGIFDRVADFRRGDVAPDAGGIGKRVATGLASTACSVPRSTRSCLGGNGAVVSVSLTRG